MGSRTRRPRPLSIRACAGQAGARIDEVLAPANVDLGSAQLRRPRCPDPPRQGQCRGRGRRGSQGRRRHVAPASGRGSRPADDPGTLRGACRPADRRPVVDPCTGIGAHATPGHGPGQDGRGHQAGSQTEGRPGQGQGGRQEGDCVVPWRLPPGSLPSGSAAASPAGAAMAVSSRIGSRTGVASGRHNLYLLGHAWGVFAPIHDGYHSGALKVGFRLVRRQGRKGPSLSDQLDPPRRQQGLCDVEYVGHGLVVESDHHPPDVRRRDLRISDPRSPGPCLTAAR